jgi:hypothetical protein
MISSPAAPRKPEAPLHECGDGNACLHQRSLCGVMKIFADGENGGVNSLLASHCWFSLHLRPIVHSWLFWRMPCPLGVLRR